MVEGYAKVILIDFGLAHKYLTLDKGELKHLPYQ